MGGVGVCTDCAAGLYGSTQGLTTADCTARCPPGRFGSTAGQFLVLCEANCSAGYYCVTGSTNATAAICPAGKYSLSGASACVDCAAGLYGSTSGLATAGCSGNCSAGYVCPSASVSATTVSCPAGKYSLAGATVCANCTAGLYGATSALPTASCTAPCPGGKYGSVSGLDTSECSGNCSAGRLRVAVPQWVVGCFCCDCACCFGCMCAGTGYFCPSGSTSPTTASCQPGTYSVSGAAVCSNCSAGRFGQMAALDTPVCSGDCPVGRYCTEGSIVPVRQKGARAVAACLMKDPRPAEP